MNGLVLVWDITLHLKIINCNLFLINQSSADNRQLISILFTISLKKMLNSKGPRTDPCEILDVA